MKRTLLTTLAVCLAALAVAQPAKMSQKEALKITAQRDYKQAAVIHEAAPYKANIVMGGEIIGQTYYDLQTNCSTPQKIVAHQDGTISACWTTCGTTAATRGTGYNYFNGTEWINGTGMNAPYQKLENERGGWGVMAALVNGEIFASHNGSDALIIGVRPQKGVGDWTMTKLYGPNASNGSSTSTALLWPAIATSGNTIHLIACTESDEGYLYEGINTCLVYYRGTYDASSNTIAWESPRVVGNVTPAMFSSFSGDDYAITAKGNTVAILVADPYHDIILWKSTDNGVNFTLSTIFDTPVPDGDFNDVIIDTVGGHAVYTSDGSCAIALDAAGNAHIAFGIQRWAKVEVGTSYTYWPYTDGIVYWNETMPPFAKCDTTLDPDFLVASGYQVFTRPDLDGDGLTYVFSNDFMTDNYKVTMSSTPQLVVDGNNVYMVYTTFLDYPFADYNSSMYYRGVFGTRSTDNGATWNNGISWLSYNNRCYYYYDWAMYDTTDIENSLNYIASEGESMYPAVAQDIVNGKITMWWQQDYLADCNGGSLSADPSNIFFFQLDANQLGVYNNTEEIPQGLWVDVTGIADNTLSGMKLYPNPASEYVRVAIASTEAAEATVSICNLMGQMVSNEVVALSEGNNEVTISTSNLNAGVYMINVKTEKGTSTQKLIVR